MRSRGIVASTILSLSVGLAMPSAQGRRSPYKLKPGSEKQLCRDCHDDFLAKIRRDFVHTPVRRGNCSACHDPHASQHQKLLESGANETCTGCHTMTKTNAVSQHAPVVGGECTKCHDAHASDIKGVLVAPQTKLCGTCHQKLVRRIAKARRPHRPLAENGCTGCHAPHESGAPHLLHKAANQLCKGCHDVGAKQFGAAHQGFAVAGATCTGCHDPHGSNRDGMLYDTTHSPMARQNCDACHDSPQDPTEMHADGSALCASCHAKQVAALTRGRRVHAAVTAGAGCLNCHTPHASAGPSLVRGGLGGACGNCHADTIARQALSAGRHQPVADGKCSACHEPHAGDTALLFKRADTMKLCGACHDWQKHTTHPLGPMFKDPRNRNLTLDCLSCHRAHGTPYDNMLPYPKANMLCVECHADYQR